MYNDPEIISPSSGESKALILVITPSMTTADTLKEYLKDLNYSVGGPFDSVDSGNMFIRKYDVDAVIFDSVNTDYELKTLKSLLKSEFCGIPLIVLSNIKIDIDYDRLNTIPIPIDPAILSTCLSENINRDHKHPENIYICFINKITQKVIELTPEGYKHVVEQVIEEGTKRLCFRNDDFLKRSNENYNVMIIKHDLLNFDDLNKIYNITVTEMIEEIDEKNDSNWAKSLFNDSIESLLITENISSEVKNLLNEMGIDAGKFKKSLASATIVSTISDDDKNTVVFNISLGDQGPDLRLSISSDENMKSQFNQGVAAQILTLVGQGSEYHQGIFGPIPIPSTLDLTAIIYSRIINSSIKDARMGGKSLNVIGIGFKRKLINCLPNRDLQKKIFNTFLEIENENEITEEVLYDINTKFKLLLKCE